MSSRTLLPAVVLLAIAASAAFLLSGHLTSQAVQNPTIALDMITTGTTYDDTTNTMTVGQIESSSTGSQSVTHTHAAHLVINNVEDLIGWQTRLNYIGDRMRVQSQNVAPFTDSNTFQTVGFSNIPIDPALQAHRNASGAASIPPAAPGPQTALLSGLYNGPENAQISPDTPAKLVPDDSSYSAPNGGVLSLVTLQVLGNQCGQTLLMDLDDDNPNAPGSALIVFNGTGSTRIDLTESQLFDGTHTEACTPGTATPTSTATATPGTITPTPTAGPPLGPLTMSLDMVPDDNTYDASTNTMTVGSIDSCLASATANPSTHVHTAALIVKNVRDLIGFDLRLNYIGDKMRPLNHVVTPFSDNIRGQGVGFVNLPIDQVTLNHRGADGFSSIPPAAPGPQTALLGGEYTGAQDFAISPDSPAKSPPDDTSYGAPSGGVLALINLEVVGDQTGQTLTMDLDDNNPNAPGSHVVVFTGAGSSTIELSEGALGDGRHVEGGASCPAPTPTSSAPPATPTRTPSATPTTTCCTTSPSPTVSASPTRTPSPCGLSCTASPSPTATVTATPTATPQAIFTFTNATGQAASDLHIVVEQNTANHAIQLVTNAPGCTQPTISVNRTQDVDFEFMDDVIWSSACVDPGESASFSIACGTGCQPSVHCYNWTIFATPIGTQCFSIRPTLTPSATASPTACPGCTPTPTRTPSPTASPSPTVSPTPTSCTPCTPTATATATHTATATVSSTPTACFSCITPTPTTTATPTPGPSGHDARLTRISGVPKNVRLLPGEVVADSGSITVANQSTHSDTIGVYVDVMAPAYGGCTPNGRVLQTTVTLAAGAKTTLSVPVSYSCADPAAANSLSYTWVAVADHGGDDLASCGPGALQSVACFNALADDDQDSSDNRASRNGPKVVAQ